MLKKTHCIHKYTLWIYAHRLRRIDDTSERRKSEKKSEKVKKPTQLRRISIEWTLDNCASVEHIWIFIWFPCSTFPTYFITIVERDIFITDKKRRILLVMNACWRWFDMGLCVCAGLNWTRWCHLNEKCIKIKYISCSIILNRQLLFHKGIFSKRNMSKLNSTIFV